MITTRTASDPAGILISRLTITFSGRSDLLKLQALLARALNCAPEFGSDWFELANQLDKFLETQDFSASRWVLLEPCKAR